MSIEEKKSISNMSFEEALKELDQIVNKIDSGQETLDKIVSAFARGAELRAHCEKKLQEAKLEVEKIITDGNGNISSIETKL